MYRYRLNDVPKWYFACTKVVLQKAHVPKLISYVPMSSCTETDHPFVPKLSCTESDVTHLYIGALLHKICCGFCCRRWLVAQRLDMLRCCGFVVQLSTCRRFVVDFVFHGLLYNTHKHFMALFWDYPGEPMPEEIFWILWCKGRYQRQTHQQSGTAPLHPD